MKNNYLIENNIDVKARLQGLRLFGKASQIVSSLFKILKLIKYTFTIKEDKVLSAKINKIVSQHPSSWASKRGKSKHFKIIIVPSEEINAFVMGFSNLIPSNITLFFYAGLVNVLGRNSDELMAVALHEIGHLAHFHAFKSAITQIPIAAGFKKLIDLILKNSKTDSKTVAKVIIGLIVLSQLTEKAISGFFSRLNEKQADQFAIDVGYGNALAQSFKKMDRFAGVASVTKCGNICQLVRQVEGVFSTHPEIAERSKDVLKRTEIWKAMKEKNDKKLNKLITNEMYQIAKDYAEANRIIIG